MGERLGRFRILSKLGEGGMGAVYLAQDPTLRRKVALKVVRQIDQSEGRRRALREARSAAAITHPNIATIYEIGEEEGCVFIAMELVSGETLRSRLAAEQCGAGLPIAEALDIAREIARGLSKAHKAGVIHRDLKPENIMISEDKQVKILDFGIAKFCDSNRGAGATRAPGASGVSGVSGVSGACGPALDPALDVEAVTFSADAATEDDGLIGTPCYMSPEQASGEPVNVTTDIFSFGVLFYEMVTCRRPFSGTTLGDIVEAIQSFDPEPPSSVNPGVPSTLEDVILRCLQKDPLARYSSGEELLQALEGDLLDDEEPAEPAKPGGRRRRARLLKASLGAAALLLAGASAAFYGAGLGPTEAPARPPRGPEAMAAYREGISANRVGRNGYPALERALKLDPAFAEVHVALTSMLYFNAIEDARGHALMAQELRASLGERDQAILAALEPIVLRTPPDYAESVRRFTAAAARFPEDADLTLLLGLNTILADGFEAGEVHIDRAIALDPELAEARAFKAEVSAYAGRFDEAHRVLDECLKAVPGAVGCLRRRRMLLEQEGACDRLEGVARQEIAAGGGAPAHWALASALAATGRPIEMVYDALRDSWRALPEQQRPRGMLSDELRLGGLLGDFDVGARRSRAMAETSAPGPLESYSDCFMGSLLQGLPEIGRADEAGAIAEAFLARVDASKPPLLPPEDYGMARDVTPLALAAARRAGRMTRQEFEVRRAGWVRGWSGRISADFRGFIWLHGYAATVESAEDAREALAALPAYEPLPRFRPLTMAGAAAGLTFLLGGRTEEAVTWLRQATKSCRALAFPLEHTRAHEWLGQALEARGDKEGACAAYKVVLDGWGNAKPRSVTAERAGARASDLGCEH
jgi:serine/threonine-protein kinase